METIYDCDEMQNQLNVLINTACSATVVGEFRIAGFKVVLDHAGVMRMEDECSRCEGSNRWARNEDMVTVITDDGNKRWAASLVSTHAFWCSHTCEYYSIADYIRISVEGTRVCLEACENDVYYWERDNNYHWEPEPEHDNSDEYIPEYHDSYKWWEEEMVEFPRHGMSVELETWSPHRIDTYQFARELRLTGELDSSLCDENGIEIIGPPMTLSEYKDNSNRWKAFCEHDDEIKCWHGRNGSYGMHVSYNLRGLSQLNIARAVIFVNENRSFCTRLAGRDNDSYASFKHIPKRNGKCKNARRYARDKYCCTNWSSNRIEFRLFRANRLWTGFLRNVEFCHAVIRFAKETKSSLLTEEHFKRWLLRDKYESCMFTKNPKHSVNYKNLIEWVKNDN